MKVHAFVMLLCLVGSTPAFGQEEDIEPRAVGGRGITQIGLSGFLDKLNSSEESFPLRATAQVDLTRFVTTQIAVRGGLVGTFSTGDAEDTTGPGVPALHATAGGFYYFTPLAMASLYGGGEYRAQLTRRSERDGGTVFGKVGLQAAVSSRVGLFVEGGYGVRLTRGSEDERQTRIVGEVGVRLKF